MLNIGDTLQQGRYRVNRQLGTGGMATVYEVFDRRLQAKFALKEAMLRSFAEQAQFEYESQLLAQLSHPNLPRVIDYFSEHGGWFLVMELVPGDNLDTIVQRQQQPFPVGIVVQWADQLLDALSYLHQQQPPVIHRDIKPPNLKIDGTGRIKLLDFGIAKQQIVGSRTMTVAQAISPHYSPPEQWHGQPTDARSDMYALGATLYHLLTGQPPVSALDRSTGQPLPSPRTLNPACPPGVAQAILRALALKPDLRFQSAAEFCDALRDGQSQPGHTRSSGRSWIIFGATGMAVLLLGAGGIMLPLTLTTWSSATATPSVVISSDPGLSTATTTAVMLPTGEPATTQPAETHTTQPPATPFVAAVTPTAEQQPTSSPLPMPTTGQAPTPTPLQLPTATLTPSPTPEDVLVAVQDGLAHYHTIRNDALRFSDMNLMQQVTIGRQRDKELNTIRQDLETGAHHEIQIFNHVILDTQIISPTEVFLTVEKTEDRLFFPYGCAVPDDTVPCERPSDKQNTKRNETYQVRYRLLFEDNVWKVEEASVLQ